MRYRIDERLIKCLMNRRGYYGLYGPGLAIIVSLFLHFSVSETHIVQAPARFAHGQRVTPLNQVIVKSM